MGNERYGYVCTVHNCLGEHLLCYGILVHKELLLTAAYCMGRLNIDFEMSDLVVQCGDRLDDNVQVSKNEWHFRHLFQRSCVRHIEHRVAGNVTGRNDVTLLHLAQSLDIVIPSIPQENTVFHADFKFPVLYWNVTNFDVGSAPVLRSYEVKSKNIEECPKAMEAVMGDEEGLLCTVKDVHAACSRNIDSEPPPGGTARPLIRIFNRQSDNVKDAKLDQIYGLEVASNDPCIHDQQELFVPVFAYADWISNAVRLLFSLLE